MVDNPLVQIQHNSVVPDHLRAHLPQTLKHVHDLDNRGLEAEQQLGKLFRQRLLVPILRKDPRLNQCVQIGPSGGVGTQADGENVQNVAELGKHALGMRRDVPEHLLEHAPEALPVQRVDHRGLVVLVVEVVVLLQDLLDHFVRVDVVKVVLRGLHGALRVVDDLLLVVAHGFYEGGRVLPENDPVDQAREGPDVDAGRELQRALQDHLRRD